MAFKIVLLNVKWDNSQKENIKFETRLQQRAFFNIPNIFTENVPNVNFKINDGISAQAYYYSDNTLANTLNYNYAIIYDDQETNDSLKYKFYFVNRIVHDSSRKCYNLELFLDIIQTYYIDLTFDDCLISRAHLDRFTEDLNSKKLNYYKSSKLYKKEDFSFNYPIISKYYNCKPQQNVDKNISLWLHKNVLAWVYYFIKQKDIQHVEQINADGTITDTNFISDYQTFQYRNKYDTFQITGNEVALTQKYFVLVAPIYFSNSQKRIRSNANITYNYLSLNNIEKFLDIEDITPYVINAKVSRLSPFSDNFIMRHHNLSIDNNDNLIITRNNVDNTLLDQSYDDFVFSKNSYLLFNTKAYIYNELDLEYIDRTTNPNGEIKNTFTFSNVVDNVKTWTGEPKNDIFTEKIKISDGLSSYEYNKAELTNNDNVFYLKYVEILNVDICRYFVYANINIDEQLDQVYYGKIGNYVGLTGSIDLSIPFAIDQLETFMANNKNFYMQYENKREYREAGYLIDSILAGGKSMLKNNVTGMLSAGVKGSYQFLGEDVTQYDRDLTMDNLASAPDNVQNINGNPLMNVFYNAIIIRLEYISCMATDEKTFDWFLKRYGYKYNELDNVKTVDNIRHYFNYVQCNIDNVYTNYGLSLLIKDEIRKIFNNGIALWRYISSETNKLFDYSVINYEERFA